MSALGEVLSVIIVMDALLKRSTVLMCRCAVRPPPAYRRLYEEQHTPLDTLLGLRKYSVSPGVAFCRGRYLV